MQDQITGIKPAFEVGTRRIDVKGDDVKISLALKGPNSVLPDESMGAGDEDVLFQFRPLSSVGMK